MSESPRQCSNCVYWDREPDSTLLADEGKCRRSPPGCARPVGSFSEGARAEWPRTLNRDWCGEWRPREEPDLGPEEEKLLRNTSAAQALLGLPSEARDRLMREVLTEEEMKNPSPPEDFHERILRYFERRKDRV